MKREAFGTVVIWVTYQSSWVQVYIPVSLHIHSGSKCCFKALVPATHTEAPAKEVQEHWKHRISRDAPFATKPAWNASPAFSEDTFARAPLKMPCIYGFLKKGIP